MEWKSTMNEQIMQQSNVYEYLGKEFDPLFHVICNMQQCCSKHIPEIKVTIIRNRHGLYEIDSKSNHECYLTKEKLYDCVNEILNTNSLLREM